MLLVHIIYVDRKYFYGLVDQIRIQWNLFITRTDSKVRGANMGPIWGREHPGGSHVGPMNLAIWAVICLQNTYERPWTLHALHRASIHWADGRLTARSRDVAKPRDYGLDFPNSLKFDKHLVIITPISPLRDFTRVVDDRICEGLAPDGLTGNVRIKPIWTSVSYKPSQRMCRMQ